MGTNSLCDVYLRSQQRAGHTRDFLFEFGCCQSGFCKQHDGDGEERVSQPEKKNKLAREEMSNSANRSSVNPKERLAELQEHAEKNRLVKGMPRMQAILIPFNHQPI